MNAFTNYQPQLKWDKHDTSKVSRNGQKGAMIPSARLSLTGSLRGKIPMNPVLSGSINTETTSPADKTRRITRVVI
jgi:hypothetical protein